MPKAKKDTVPASRPSKVVVQKAAKPAPKAPAKSAPISWEQDYDIFYNYRKKK